MKKNISILIMAATMFCVRADILDDFNRAQVELAPLVEHGNKKAIILFYNNLITQLYLEKKLRQDQYAELLRLQDAVLLYAAFLGQVKIVELLLQKGEPVDQQSYPGYTALHYAIRGCYPDVVRLLLEHGANCMVESKYGETPLAYSRESTPEIFELVQLYNGQPVK